jgi:hypothetical protein
VPSRIPLLLDPIAPAQGRLVGGRVGRREARCFEHLLHESGLAHLPRPGDDLQEPARFPETPGKHCTMWSREHAALADYSTS